MKKLQKISKNAPLKFDKKIIKPVISLTTPVVLVLNIRAVYIAEIV